MLLASPSSTSGRIPIPIPSTQPQPQPQQPVQHPAISSSKKQSAISGSVVTASFWSQALGITKRAVIWLPPSYNTQPTKRYPVAYYLHGAWGDETNWTKLGRLDTSLDSLAALGVPEMIVVMPDGDDGWYTTWNFLGDYAACRRNRPASEEPADTYCVPWPKYDDYIARDLVAFVDSAYRTRADRVHRGIAGLSMGGYGAVILALSYPDVFAGAASHSGAVAPAAHGRRAGDEPRYATTMSELQAAWGPRLWSILEPAFGKDTSAWLARDPLRRVQRLLRQRPALMPRLYLDCGVDDFLLDENRTFRLGLERLGVLHHYVEFPGTHNWDYWRRHAAESARWLAENVFMR